ncbi:peptide/nickel transport system substrate-binding protein [Microbacterium testaceum]|uniref:ABC transporter substrate-binding protein n=1 Tax=Microbacterium TaxID=33882 RepID=UPI001AE77C48|nr:MULTISPECIES: ABC transporter substrate-binding protein [Microbacterium]MDQ1111624.1 peptide/nickel transport system substrate-binding protein [Microbacterium testaceum]MDR6097840.1 peptide/nickel transport system substrate-binding protein [Microbacterium sp. SORGH_AS_0454]
MPRPLRVTAAIALSLSVTAALAGCAGSSSASSTDELDIATTVSAVSFDPYLADSGPSIWILQPAYETLITKNVDGTYTPGLASAYEYLSPTSFQLTVRDGVTFSDGTVLDAAGVVANLERVKTVSGPAIGNAAAIDTITATDAKTVLITLSAPFPAMEDLLSHNVGMMVSPADLSSPDLATEPAGTGPYVLDTDATVSGDHWRFVRNEDYWGDASAFSYDALEYKYFTDPSSTLNAVRAGTMDIALGNTTTAAAAKSAGLQIVTQATDTWGLVLGDRAGTNQPALGDVRVRQALNYAIDRDAITKAVVGEYGSPAHQYFGTQTTGNVPALDDAYPYDPEKAKELLADAGYANGFTFAVTSVPGIHDAMVQAIQGYLAEVGVTMTIDQDGDFFANVQAAKDPAYALTYTQGDMYTTLAPIVTPTGVLNPYKSSDERINSLYAQAAASSDPAEQTSLYQQIAQIVSDDAWFLPVYYADVIVYASKNVQVKLWPGEGYPWIYAWSPIS